MASSHEASKSQSRRGSGPPPNAPRWPAAMAPGVPRGTYKPRGGPPKTLTAPLPRSQLPASSPAPPTTTTPEPVETGYDVMARREQVCEDELCDIYQKQSGMAEFLARERANAEVGDQYRRIVRRRDTGNSNSPSLKRENLPPIPEETSTSANEDDWTEISAETKRVGETLSVIQPLNPANTAQQEAVQDMANVSLPSGRYPGGRYIALTPSSNVGSQTQPRQTSQIMRYPTTRQQADYHDLFEGSEAEETPEIHKQGRWPTFQTAGDWPDGFADRYSKAVETENDLVHKELSSAYHTAQSKGLDMKKEGLEEVKEKASLGHDGSERGVHKFNEELQVRAREKMMREAGIRGRFGAVGQKAWYTKDDK